MPDLPIKLDSYFAELKEGEILKSRVDIAEQMREYIGKYFSHEFVMKEIFQMTEEKIEEQRKQDEDGTWTWINYRTLLDDMPLLEINSPGALTPRIKKIEEAGFIKTKIIASYKFRATKNRPNPVHLGPGH